MSSIGTTPSNGLGPTLGHVRVEGSRSRDGTGLRVDMAASDGADGHRAVLAAGGRHRHGPGYEELDDRVAGISVRRDRFVLVEIGVSHDLGKNTTIRADFTWGRNAANLAIDENRMRAFSVTLPSAY